MKKFLIGTSVFLGIGLLLTFWQGDGGEPVIEEGIVLELYYGHSCPHCHDEMEWLPKLQKIYPDLKVQEFEIWNNATNKKFLEKRLNHLNKKFIGVPTNIIGDEVIVGFDKERIVDVLIKKFGPPQTEKTTDTGEAEPMACSTEATSCDSTDVCKELSEKLDCEVPKQEESCKKYLNYSWPIMSFVLGILDGFNPCAMWSLLILLGFLLPMQNKRRRWWIGGIFIGASFLIYFVALLTYLLGFESVSKLIAMSIMQWLFRIVGLMALSAGIFALREAKNQEIECKVQNADQKHKFASKIEDILSREKFILVLVGITGLAFSVNAVELLCSIAIPTTFTATLVSNNIPFWQQLLAITIYDIAYILDDVIVFSIAMWTMSLKVLSPRLVQVSHAIGGLLLVIIGILMIFKPEFLSMT